MEGEIVQGGRCKCVHHNMKAIWMILFGMLFLLGALGVVSSEMVKIGWPIIVILAGVTKMTKGMCKCCDGCQPNSGKCC
ncbi:MAG: hypothetical protein Q7S83_00570 [bacterium]|nr:hypothetical protein [bacterium]